MHAEQFGDAVEHRGIVGADAPGREDSGTTVEQGSVVEAADWLGIVGGIHPPVLRLGGRSRSSRPHRTHRKADSTAGPGLTAV
jgi:hypothetical protein